jgi:hypothetical protein
MGKRIFKGGRQGSITRYVDEVKVQIPSSTRTERGNALGLLANLKWTRKVEGACLIEATSDKDLKSESNTMCNSKKEIMSFRNDLTWHSTNGLRKVWIMWNPTRSHMLRSKD